jgi:hypothetical protein
MKGLRLFDANVYVGRPATPFFGSWMEVPDLIREMDEFAIERALIYHIYSREVSSLVGNSAATDAAMSVADGRLVAVWALQTQAEDGGRTPRDQIDDALSHGVGSVRLDPWPAAGLRNRGVTVRESTLDLTEVADVCTTLESVGIPLTLDIDQATWSEVFELCRAFPKMPIILLNVSYKHQRSLFAGLARFKNLYFEISSYHAHHGIEDLHEAFGPAQILFGTRLPDFTPASAISMLVYAEIPKAAKQAIAAENLNALLRT